MIHIIHGSHVNSVPSIWKYTIIIFVECLLGHQKPCPMRIRWWPCGMNTQGYPASIWLHQIDRYWYCKYIPLPVHIAGLGLASDHETAKHCHFIIIKKEQHPVYNEKNAWFRIPSRFKTQKKTTRISNWNCLVQAIHPKAMHPTLIALSPDFHGF